LAVLFDSHDKVAQLEAEIVAGAAQKARVTVVTFDVHGLTDIQAAFASMAKSRPQVLQVVQTAVTAGMREQIAALAEEFNFLVMADEVVRSEMALWSDSFEDYNHWIALQKYKHEALGKVSGWGWSLGYFGGILALAVSLAWVMSAESRGSTTSLAVPGTMIITAAIFALAALPTFIFLKERAQPATVPGARAAFARLVETARSARRYRDLLLVFACGVCYQAGVATVIALAAIYAEQVMGFETKDTIMLVLVVNITAAIGAFGFGYAQDRVGKTVALRWTIVGWVAMVVVAYFARTPGLFWVAANLAGLCMGSSQSAGRALVAYLSPVARSAEFFGLWGVAVRLAAILGPLTYGAVTWVTGGNHRLAILLTGAFFIAALIVLAFVNEQRGRDQVK